MIETKTLKRSSTNSDIKMEVNAISDYLKPNMPLPQYLPLCPLSAGYRPEPHRKAALHSAAGPGNAFSKEQLDRYTGAHLCNLSAFPSGKRFRVLHFQCNALFLRTGKCTARRTCPQRLFQAQSHSAQGSAYYAELRCHSMQKCRA